MSYDQIVALIGKLVTAEYAAMFVLLALLAKYVAVPFVKWLILAFWADDTHEKGYTPVVIGYLACIVMAFILKLLQSVGGWTVKDVLMTVIVACAAAATAIGANVTTQALKGSNVSITQAKR